MKYKIGDEVFVRCKIINAYPGSNVPYEVVLTKYNPGFAKPLYIAVREDDIEDMTAEEAWEIAKKIADMLCEESNKIFGTAHLEHILQRNTPQEAKAKIEAWEAEKEIKVGDVVTITNNDPTSITNGKTVHTGVITSAHPDNYYDLILGGGLAWSYVDGEKIKKTGRHIDIEGILKQIGGTDA